MSKKRLKASVKKIVTGSVEKKKSKGHISDKVSIPMPLSTAAWLIRNTSLTFDQIAEFCDMSLIDVIAIENGTIADNIIATNPVGKYVLESEIARCQEDPYATLIKMDNYLKGLKVVIPKVKKYTPLIQRQNKPDSILWILTFFPELTDRQIIKLIRTTESTIMSIKNRSHRSMSSLVPKDPVILGLCTRRDFENAVAVAKERARIIAEEERKPSEG